jgi:pyroglutamyl-peptidase
VVKKVLLTGFEPFAGASLNPSQLVVAELSKSEIPNAEIITAVLPVEYLAASTQLIELIDQHQPNLVLALGQAEGRTEISIEKIAINLASSSLPDNSGIILTDAEITKSGQPGYFSSLPISNLVSVISAKNIKAGISLSAGSFVCNYIFYRMQEKLADTNVLSGFIHLPLVPQQQIEFPEKPTMPLEQQVKAIELIIRELVQSIT